MAEETTVTKNLWTEHLGKGFAAKQADYAIRASEDVNGTSLTLTIDSESDTVTHIGGKNISAKNAETDINGNSLELTISGNTVTAIGGKTVGGGSEPVDAYTKAETDELLGDKANKSEMSVTPGTDADDDKTTIQLKTGTSATVLTKHQDVSSMLGKSEFGGTILDTSGDPITDNTGDAIQDETMVELYDSFETTKFGAERASADASGHDIETTYATKSELNTLLASIESQLAEI